MHVRRLRYALKRKLRAEEDRKGHHVYFYISIGDRFHRAAKLSHSFRGELPNFVVQDIARRLKLSRKELSELVDCPLEGEQFYKLWEERDPV